MIELKNEEKNIKQGAFQKRFMQLEKEKIQLQKSGFLQKGPEKLQ